MKSLTMHILGFCIPKMQFLSSFNEDIRLVTFQFHKHFWCSPHPLLYFLHSVSNNFYHIFLSFWLNIDSLYTLKMYALFYKFMGPSGIYEFILPSPALLSIGASEVIWKALRIFADGSLPSTQLVKIYFLPTKIPHIHTKTYPHKLRGTHTNTQGEWNNIIL